MALISKAGIIVECQLRFKEKVESTVPERKKQVK